VPKRYRLFIFIIFSLFFIILYLKGLVVKENQVCFKGKCIDVEIAQTMQERMRGLQGREVLPEDAGMFFVFPKSARHSFWMKDTLIPLDIIWIDDNQEVVHIQHSAVPCKEDPCSVYIPGKKALYVLEVNEGGARKYGIEVGSRIKIKIN